MPTRGSRVVSDPWQWDGMAEWRNTLSRLSGMMESTYFRIRRNIENATKSNNVFFFI